MYKSIPFLLSGCVLLLLSGCLKSPGPACGQRPCLPNPDCYDCKVNAEDVCPSVCPCAGKAGKTYDEVDQAGVDDEYQGQANGLKCAGNCDKLCPEGMICVDIPDDGCDPAVRGTECEGVCEPQ